MKIEIKIADISKLEAAIGMVADEATRKSVAEKQVKVLVQMSKENFDSAAGRPAPWAPLAESTVAGFSGARKHAVLREAKAAKKAKRPARDPRPLIDNSNLIKSFSVQNATELGAELVSSAMSKKGAGYAAYHQFGSVKKPGHPPARPFVPVTGAWGSELQPTAAAEERMVRAGEAVLRAAAKRAGFKIER